MELQIFNQQYLSNLQRIHDLIKHHPFRISFSENDIATYKTLLYDLTEVWADIIYRSEYQDPKDTLQLRKFGFWIHDYRQVLSRGQKKAFPMGWFDYFEQMLQVTHVFLSTGCIEYFYNPDTLSDKDGTKIMKSEKYEWITSKNVESMLIFFQCICQLHLNLLRIKKKSKRQCTNIISKKKISKKNSNIGKKIFYLF